MFSIFQFHTRREAVAAGRKHGPGGAAKEITPLTLLK
jgi:hypothetical protein